MAEPAMTVRIMGMPEIEGALDGMLKRVDRASYTAMKKSQTVAKASIKSGMRGRPRWDQRGKRSYQGAGVNLHLNPHHVAKSGGPGSLTGALHRAVGAVKRPKRDGDLWRGGVGTGGPDSYTNRYRKVVEGKYPYTVPGVRKAEPKMALVWEKEWAAAMESAVNAPITGATE